MKRVATVPLDVHLMITDPDDTPKRSSRRALECCRSTSRCCRIFIGRSRFIKSLGVKAGVVLNPSTPVVALEEIAGDVDFVLVMSVNPGFGGQKFIPRSEQKVRAVRALLDRAGQSPRPIEIDGGIDLSNIARVVEAGRGDRRRRLRDFRRARSDRRDRSALKTPPRRSLPDDRHVSDPTSHQRPSPIRRDRQDGRGVSRQLFRLVRNRPLRAAARHRTAAIERWKRRVSGCRSSRRTANTKSPARYDDELQVKTRGELLSPARVEFSTRSAGPATATVNAHRPHRSCGHGHGRAAMPAARLHPRSCLE